MTAFVESCVATMVGSAQAAVRRSRKRPRANRLLKALSTKKRILITTHIHPDPDALASALAMAHLLRARLKDADVQLSFKGRVGGGLNDAYARHLHLNPLPWDDQTVQSADAVVLLDTQPGSAYSPLSESRIPDVVIDHHRGGGRKPCCTFTDIRDDVGATSSIIFSYFQELEQDIPADLAAAMLYAVESDLAGAAGTPSELDNIALSNLTLIADTHLLYQMRYVNLPQSYYVAYALALQNATFNDFALTSHIGEIDSLEKPAVMADFLLRFEQVRWVLVSAVHENRLVLSLRCSDTKLAASQMIRRLLKGIGEGGGHRSKAGGFIALTTGSDAEIDRHRKTLRRRLLRVLRIASTRPSRIIP